MGGVVKKALPIATIASYFIPGIGPYLAIGLTVLQVALSKKPGDTGIDTNRPQERTITTQSAVMPRTVLIGDVPGVGGSLINELSSSNNKYFWRVVCFTTHPIGGYTAFYFDGEPVYPWMIASDGRVTHGKFKDKLYVWYYDGTQTTADPNLTATFPDEYSASDVGFECAYVVVRYEFDQKVFPGAPPEVTADIRGALLYDPRDQQTRYSDNAVLGVQTYLTDFYGGKWGTSIPINEVEESFTIDGANIADEFVPSRSVQIDISGMVLSRSSLVVDDDVLKLQRRDRVTCSFSGTPPAPLQNGVDYYVIPFMRKKGKSQGVELRLAASDADAQAGVHIVLTSDENVSGSTVTKNAQPRYRISGEIKQDVDPGRIVKDMLSCMAGTAPAINGIWRIFPAAWRGSVMTINQDEDFLSSFKITTKITRRDRINALDGNYFSALYDGQPTGYPRVTNSAYVAEDGETLVGGFDQPFTPNALQAQMVGNIVLERTRRTIIGDVDLSMKALALAPPDVITVNSPMYGFVGSTFEVEAFKWKNEEIKGNPAIVPRVNLRTTDPGIYDYDPALQEQIPDVPPPTVLPDPFDIDPVQELAAGTSTTVTGEGTLVYGVILTWAPPENFFVLKDGKFEVEFKRVVSGNYQPVPTYDGSVTRAWVNGLTFDEEYDFRVRAITHVGGQSDWQNLRFRVGDSGGGVSERIDLGLVSEAVTEIQDLGLVSEAVTETKDFGLVGV